MKSICIFFIILLISRGDAEDAINPIEDPIQPAISEEVHEAMRRFGEKRFDSAEVLFKGLQEKYPAHAELFLYYRGECLYQLKNYTAAQNFLEKAAATPYNRQEALWRLVQVELEFVSPSLLV